MIGLIAAASVSCSSAAERPALSEAQLAERTAADASGMQAAIYSGVGKVFDRIQKKASAPGALSSPTIHFLAISGGGDHGAFGAGFWVGRGEVRWLAAEADYVNEKYGADIEVRVVAIPDDWRPPVEGRFVQETMVSLLDLGRKLGADPKAWTV